MGFPIGPFFNFRTPDEMPAWKRVIWILFGEVKESIDHGYLVKAYYFRGITLIAKCEPVDGEKE